MQHRTNNNEHLKPYPVFGQGNIRIHSYHPQRYRCHTCKKTFSTRRGTMMEGLGSLTELAVILLSYGCPIQAIVHAYGLDERIVAEWKKASRKALPTVHHATVEQGKVETHHVQADAHSGKREEDGRLDATSRLWLAGVVSVRRDRELVDRLVQHVRACCQSVRTLLVCTDGWAASLHSIMRAFLEKMKKTAWRGRCSLELWPNLCIATVIKRMEKKRVWQSHAR